jgi:ribosomal protein S18 acetylase RimI-like enzyme
LVAVGLKSIARPGVISGAISVVKVLLNSNQDEPTPRTQLLSLAVNPESRNEGIGKSLVRELETELGIWNVNECLVWTTQSNLGAIAFYESNGFKKSFVFQHSTEKMVGLIKVQDQSKM